MAGCQVADCCSVDDDAIAPAAFGPVKALVGTLQPLSPGFVVAQHGAADRNGDCAAGAAQLFAYRDQQVLRGGLQALQVDIRQEQEELLAAEAEQSVFLA